MLRTLWERIRQKSGATDSRSAAAIGARQQRQVVLFASVGQPPSAGGATAERSAGEPRSRHAGQPRSRHVGHRQRILETAIEELQLFSRSRCRELRDCGVETAREFLARDAGELIEQMDAVERVARSIEWRQRAVKFAMSIPGMMPCDALLLFHVHRRSLKLLASESPIQLHRDLERFAWCSRGQRLLKGRPLPDRGRLHGWIDYCARHYSGKHQPGKRPGAANPDVAPRCEGTVSNVAV